jgi:hypothetical protein
LVIFPFLYFCSYLPYFLSPLLLLSLFVGYEELEILALLTGEQIDELSVTIKMRPGHKVKFPLAIQAAREELELKKQKAQEPAQELANIERDRKLAEVSSMASTVHRRVSSLCKIAAPTPKSLRGLEQNSFNDDQEETEVKQIAEVLERMVGHAAITVDFVIFVIVAAILAAVGLIIDSPAIVVAAMLVSPLMGPVLAASAGCLLRRRDLFCRSLKTETVAIGICILIGIGAGVGVGSFVCYDSETDIVGAAAIRLQIEQTTAAVQASLAIQTLRNSVTDSNVSIPVPDPPTSTPIPTPTSRLRSPQTKKRVVASAASASASPAPLIQRGQLTTALNLTATAEDKEVNKAVTTQLDKYITYKSECMQRAKHSWQAKYIGGGDGRLMIRTWPTKEMLGRSAAKSGFLVGFIVAFVSAIGLAVSITKQETNALVGIAISASLLPPV